MRIRDDSFVLPRPRRRRLLKMARQATDAALRTRYMIVLHTAEGKSQRRIAEMLGTCVATVKRTRTRWREGGEAALVDRREDNALLKKLLKAYADRRVVHVILDNYKIHRSVQTRTWLAEHGGRIRLHFLPPYCPDDNRIERCICREVHADVTRNHTCSSIDELMDEVACHLTSRNREAQRRWLRSA